MKKTLDKTNRKFTSRMQASLLLVFCVVALLMVGMMGRLIYIMQTDGDKYAKQVLSRQTYVSSVLPYKRGDIIDRNGTVLAHSELQYKMILDPKLLLENEDNITPTIDSLCKNFDIEADAISTILENKPDSQYVIALKNLKYDTVKNYKKVMEKNSKILGVWFEEEYVRTYPFDALACDILGFSSMDNTGYWGIEEYYNDELNGTNGREYGYFDSELDIEKIVKEAANGNSVVSTIDADVQRILQEKIIEFNSEGGSKGIGILVMDPNNGDIIAMASNSEYNLNSPRSLESFYTEQELSTMTEEEKTEALNTIWKNDAISFTFEPGSTFKPVTVAAALEENLVSNSSTFICDGGEDKGGPEPIKCSNRAGHGELTLEESLMYSCNDAMMQIADKEGNDIFYKYLRSFGFGQKTGIDLPGEESGIVYNENNAGVADLATNSFGQNTNVTMIQLASAFSSLVNGGYYYQPHVMKKIVNDNGATIKEFDKVLVKQTVSEQTSDLIQEYMYQTVASGTAKGAQVEGYAIGGKTGTAQKYPRGAGTYIVSFIGCVPAIDPEVVIYVIIDEPQNVEKQADSSIATKFASRTLKEILPVLGIFPDGEIDYLLPTPAPNDDPTIGVEGASGNAAVTETETGDAEEEQDNQAIGENQTTEGNTSEDTLETTETTESNEFNPNAIE